MSLTALIRHKTPVRIRMASDFPKPRMRLEAPLRVPPLAPNRPLIGTAFDYLVRFHLQRALPFASAREWVAEQAHDELKADGEDGLVLVTDGTLRSSASVRRSVRRTIGTARRLLKQWPEATPASEPLLRAALQLAHCDIYYRIRRIDPKFARPLPSQVQELRQLLEIIDWSAFTATHCCLLNPTFGQGSIMAGGADADLLLDDTLIELKTSSTLRVATHDWRQLIAYAALSVHFPIGDGVVPVPINRVGVNFARHGHLVTWPLAELVDLDKFATFARWLRTYLKRMHAEREAIRKEIEAYEQREAAREARRREREARLAKRRRRHVQKKARTPRPTARRRPNKRRRARR